MDTTTTVRTSTLYRGLAASGGLVFAPVVRFEAEKVVEIIKYEMENAVSLAVPLTVDVHCGHSWAEAH